MFFVNYIRGLSAKEKSLWVGAIVLVTVLALLPLVIDVDMSYFGYYFFITCVYLTLAQSWNVIGGYTGQISLSQNAFFGIGAYVTGGLWLHGIGLYFFFDFALMLAAGIAPAIVAAIIGIPLLVRLRGDYFAFGTLGFSMIVLVLFLKGGNITGGALGLRLDSSVFTSMLVYYWVGLAVATASTLLVYIISRSHMGLALRAIREDEISAAAHGINVLKYKVLAFSIGGFLAGVAGSLYAYYIFDLKPDNLFVIGWGIYPILICVLGGAGTVFGPVIGAFLVSALFAYGNIYFTGYQTIFVGLLIIGLAGRVLRLGRGRSAQAGGAEAVGTRALPRTRGDGA